MLIKILYKHLKIPARFSKKFALGPKFADYEALYDVPDNQKIPSFVNFLVFLYWSKPAENCPDSYHFDR